MHKRVCPAFTPAGSAHLLLEEAGEGLNSAYAHDWRYRAAQILHFFPLCGAEPHIELNTPPPAILPRPSSTLALSLRPDGVREPTHISGVTSAAASVPESSLVAVPAR
jgi:hypothetical protein